MSRPGVTEDKAIKNKKRRDNRYGANYFRYSGIFSIFYI